jgi:hypothetical protein
LEINKDDDVSSDYFTVFQMPGGPASSETERVEALAARFKAQFLPVKDPSNLAVT